MQVMRLAPTFEEKAQMLCRIYQEKARDCRALAITDKRYSAQHLARALKYEKLIRGQVHAE